jgi:hypothetical protein
MFSLNLVFVYGQYVCLTPLEAIAIVAEYIVDVAEAAMQKRSARRNEIFLFHLMEDQEELLPYYIDRRDWHRFNVANGYA